ncbi:hypothetical protein POX_e06444 [Penicillium oxalicum]|uniref:hypothetical protein n=1 Tax=Penicillium oxalicum TaxID=69781 RepID=UPI0020B83F94|nr:hypothetical protein POX_e06444 [Penicillium oxalicum]KAI2788428.1 hypothetical protein POX_e06444 [Penicillium oxalicum]
MRFLSTVLVAAGLATSAICAEMSMASSHTGPAISAAPSPVSKCASAKTDLTLLEQNQCAVALLPPGCNIQTCLNVGPTINCIIKALQTGSLINLAQCLTTGLQEICACGACIPILGSLLSGLCAATQDTKDTDSLTAHLSMSQSATSRRPMFLENLTLTVVPSPGSTPTPTMSRV